MIILDYPQGSPEWHRARLGVITASKIDCVLAGKETAKRATYMAELIAEVCTGESAELSAKQLEWGKNFEQSARSAYELTTGLKTNPVGFIYRDQGRRTGCSPDALIEGMPRGLELKCPFATKTHIEFLCDAIIKREYVLQCMFGMWVTGFETWDFASYDPRMKSRMLHFVTIERDQKTMALLDDAVPQFIHEMDAKLREILGDGFRNFVTNLGAGDGAATVEEHHPQE